VRLDGHLWKRVERKPGWG